jgi:hypothetical protein
MTRQANTQDPLGHGTGGLSSLERSDRWDLP